MAQQDAMEQVKEVVRQVIRYRFWISVGVAALFGVIAYFVGAGPVQEETKKEIAAIKAAETDVKQYTAPNIPTKEYKPLVDEKTQILTKDVHTAWKTLYDRQAPLLTWPETVQERFQKWGRKWPEDEGAGKVTLAQVDYIAAYNDYVDMVYQTFKPFDYDTGEGIVVAPPKETLLRPAVFSDEHVPGLSKIWSAQERLWIQRTLLEVVSQVNKNAKNWSSAIIRQIETIEVGNPVAQDQRSLAKNEELKEAPAILAPGETEESAQPAAGGGGGAGGAMMEMMKGGGKMMGMGGAATNQSSQTVYYVTSGNDQQYKVLPVLMTVLIDQDHVQDFLVELENSPMSIDVKDFDLQRPTSRVTKPEKGATAYAGSGEGMMGHMGMMGMMMGKGMMGFGGKANEMAQMRGQMMGRSMMGGMMGANGKTERKGKDVRSKDRAKERDVKEKAIEKATGPSLFDPFFDIVQVTVYGQARFFNPPPADAVAEPSPGETAADAKGAAEADAKGAAAADAKGAAEADAKGAAAADTEGAADAKGATAADAKGAADTKGAAAADTKGAAGAKGAAGQTPNPAAQPDSKGAAQPADGSGKSAAPNAAAKTNSDAKGAKP